jgi:hypothetical protein
MKNQQNYRNHRRRSPVYLFTALNVGLVIYSVIYLYREDFSLPAWLFLGLSISLLALNSMFGFYTTRLQDRIIRTEENLRHFMLTGKALDSKLTLTQIVALRYASDTEFPGLCQQAVQENMTADQIKRSITHWQKDSLRV